MRKKIVIILIAVISFCFCIPSVNAAGELVYDIDKMTVSNTAITFEGWGLINFYNNNYGGSTTRINIYALREGDNNRNNWVLANVSYNSKYNLSLYEANCIRGSGTNASCLESYENATCNQNSSTSSCRYDNVGFKATFSLDNLFEKIGKDVDISFKIEVINSSASTQIADLGVYTINSNVENGSIYNGSNYSVLVSDLSEFGRIIVTHGRVLQNSQGTFAHGSSFYWNFNNNYRIFDKTISNGPKVTGLNMYGLYYGTPNGNSCYDGSTISNSYATTYGGCPGWAYATWVQVAGKVIIRLQENDEEECRVNDNKDLSCENGEYNSSCEYDITSDYVTIRYPSTSEPSCSSTISLPVEGSVQIIQDGDLKFDLYTGQVYAGGGFTFGVSYTNTAYWKYNGSVEHAYSKEYRIGSNGCPYVYAPKECHKEPCGIDSTCCVCNYEYYYWYSGSCNSNQEYEEYMAKATAKKYIGLDNSDLSVTMPNSNVVNGSNNYNVGYWECESPTVNMWYSSDDDDKNILTAKCTYKMKDAYINKADSYVSYGSYYSGNSNYLYGNNESGEPMYYIPLKWPTGRFPVNASFSGLSSVSGMYWGGTYRCDVNCQQKLFDLDNGGYLYFFRPISLSDPFPNGRQAGRNWYEWISDVKNQERLLNTYSSVDNLEYTLVLTNTDIANIKKYNSDLNYGGGRGYLNYSIDINGNSDFIKGYSYFTYGSSVQHSGLGVFNSGDDLR